MPVKNSLIFVQTQFLGSNLFVHNESCNKLRYIHSNHTRLTLCFILVIEVNYDATDLSKPEFEGMWDKAVCEQDHCPAAKPVVRLREPISYQKGRSVMEQV